MTADAQSWVLLFIDISLKAVLLAALAAAGLAALRVKNMLAMPLLVQLVPGLAIPIPASVLTRFVELDHRTTRRDLAQVTGTASGIGPEAVGASGLVDPQGKPVGGADVHFVMYDVAAYPPGQKITRTIRGDFRSKAWTRGWCTTSSFRKRQRKDSADKWDKSSPG